MASPAPAPDLSSLDTGDGRRIAIRHRVAPPGAPTILFLPGYASDMEGGKAVAIDGYCARNGLGCLRLDYSGTGSSAGDFADGTLGRWLDEVLAAIDVGAPEGRIIVAGSSMGGWLALHAALHRPRRVAALLGIAAAPDFTDWGFAAEEKATLATAGRLERPNPYGPEPSVTHLGFWQSGEAHQLLNEPIGLDIPIRLIHGEKDEDVPMGIAIRLMDALGSADVQLRLIKGGGHRLSEPHEIAAILAELDGLVAQVRAGDPT